MSENFSTLNLESRHRFEAWRAAVCSRLINAEARQTETGDFAGSFSYGMLTDVAMACHSAHSSLLWQRTVQCIRKYPDDNYYLGYIQHGYGHLEQNNHAVKIQPGDLVIYDAAMPFNFAMRDMCINIIRLPRPEFNRKSPRINTISGMKLDPLRPGVNSLRQLLLEAFSWNSLEENVFHSEELAGTLMDMISACINLQKCEETKKTDLYHQMVKYLKNNLHQHDISVSTLANAHHISPRTVNRIFAAHNTTPMNLLRHERLISCRKNILEGRVRSITELALDHGFIDMSHFSLSFKKAFGCTPSSLSNHSESDFHKNR
ncbi:AraC family transcriptional regulator (plasmid) [Klebsiella michiganensis]|uniref:AraC family transcriptional regulator n=1 Tax=Klebsiella michiganensis TaxID=1134687 RepID=UPI002658C647|nr:AraC family transcriptional regulator [Klebsiella michiganensis]WKJ95782.1 AraC family transcriptional regulator [Klebsiella michiganensis]WKK01079.1 AraC family transcriptional regulator [Klebsiella michiganensis]WKK02872.1 AraC family transcriptional regulator [Klebsiella michiganensis]WKK07006.1 AraC family transcriptional regulator [Klebsiella michiganensis]